MQNCHGQNGRAKTGCFHKERTKKYGSEKFEAPSWKKKRHHPQDARHGRSQDHCGQTGRTSWWRVFNRKEMRKYGEGIGVGQETGSKNDWSTQGSTWNDCALSLPAQAQDVMMGMEEARPVPNGARQAVPAEKDSVGRPTVGRSPTPRDCREQGKPAASCHMFTRTMRGCLETGSRCTASRRTCRSSNAREVTDALS